MYASLRAMTSEEKDLLAAAAAAARQQPKQPKKKGKGGEEGDGEAGEESEDGAEEDPEDGFRQPDRIDIKPGAGLQTLPALQTFASQYLWSMKGHPFVLFNDSAKHAGLHHELQSGGAPAAAAAGAAGGGGQGLGPEDVMGLKELAERAASTGGGRLGSIMEQSDLAATNT